MPPLCTCDRTPICYPCVALCLLFLPSRILWGCPARRSVPKTIRCILLRYELSNVSKKTPEGYDWHQKTTGRPRNVFLRARGGTNIPASALVDSKWLHTSSRKDMVVPLDYTFHYQLLFSLFTLKGPVEIPCRPPAAQDRHKTPPERPQERPDSAPRAPQNLATDFDNSVEIRCRPPPAQDRPKTPPERPREERPDSAPRSAPKPCNGFRQFRRNPPQTPGRPRQAQDTA